MKKMDPSVEAFAISLPGRATRLREPLIDNVPELIRQLLAHAGHLFEEKPFLLFGHSFGTLVVYHLSRELKRLGKRTPQHILISSRPHPGHLYSEYKHTLTDAKLKLVLKEFAGTPQQILDSDDFMAMSLPILRADWKANDTYSVEYPLKEEDMALCGIPMTLYWAMNDLPEIVQFAHLWEKYTTGKVTKRIMPGDHFWLQTPENLAELLRRFAIVAADPQA
jgi:medium-chain acyl-[acyl-carrier-protein] hydrolase